MSRRNLMVSLVLSTMVAGTASANIIGSAVSLSGTVDGGTVDNPINFYIPLSENASGLYGNGGVGLTSDICSTAPLAVDQCGSGFLGMLLEFQDASEGSHQMTLQFSDLDLAGVNDPHFFFETLSIFSLNSTPTFDFVWSALDPLVTFANHDDQTLDIAIDYFSGGDLYFGLLFGSAIYATGTFQNTEETLIASLRPRSTVPEPATLSLLGAGLLAIGFAGRRKRKTT